MSMSMVWRRQKSATSPPEQQSHSAAGESQPVCDSRRLAHNVSASLARQHALAGSVAQVSIGAVASVPRSERIPSATMASADLKMRPPTATAATRVTPGGSTRRPASTAAAAAAHRRASSPTASSTGRSTSPSHSAVASSRVAILDAMRERQVRGGPKLQTSFSAIVDSQHTLTDAGRSHQGDSAALRAHINLAQIGRQRSRGGKSRGERAQSPKAAKKKRGTKGATVVVPWEMRDQLDKSSEIVAAREHEGLGNASRVLVKGVLRADGRDWWAPQMDQEELPQSDIMGFKERPTIFGFQDFEQRGLRAIAAAAEQTRHMSKLEADTDRWSTADRGMSTTTLERMAETFSDTRAGPRLGNLKAREGGTQVRGVPTASELFEVLDAEARIAGAMDETEHWSPDALSVRGLGRSLAGPEEDGTGGADEEASEEDDDPLPSLDDTEDPAEASARARREYAAMGSLSRLEEPAGSLADGETVSLKAVATEPEPEPEPQPEPEPEPEAGDGGQEDAGAEAENAGGEEDLPLAEFSDDDEHDAEIDEEEEHAEISPGKTITQFLPQPDFQGCCF